MWEKAIAGGDRTTKSGRSLPDHLREVVVRGMRRVVARYRRDQCIRESSLETERTYRRLR